MGSTIIEKILEKASGKKVAPGDKVWAKIDLVAMRDFGGPNVILKYEKEFDDEPVFDPEKIAITFDLHIPPRQIKEAENQKICREFARKKGVKLFDINHGIGQHTLLENGLVKPYDVIIGTDSHMNLLGVAEAFSTGVGITDIVTAMRYGKLWFRVPETVKININGKPGEFVTPKDVILHLVGYFGADGLSYKSVEFYGDFIENLGLDGRITIASMVTEMDGKIGFMVPNAEVINFLKEKTGKDIKPISPDKDAEYIESYDFDISNLEPMISCPHSPDNVKAVREVEGKEIDQVFIGSCTNGRIEDLRIAAKILKGKRVKARTIITPSTTEVAKQALREGLIEVFLESGAVVTNPSCALCTIGHPGVLAKGDVTLSTSNRNYPGKIGKGGEIYLVSPATAAASAINGKITDPRDMR
ncbi:MAG TPA: 3-isopropylmalate dehydratase large subunit [Thermoplasmatales archaeon]|nr:3-isopropylmalate dehydratase large subunit [Thermoplasmatales archaeon]